MDIKNMMEHRTVLSNEAFHYVKGYLIYLRKSRQDDPNETVEEVLAKHETILQELAVRELGGHIPEENIYREIVSGGESIDERIEIKKVLSRLEDDDVRGVLVVDPQRLSRGSLTDCDRLIMSFQFTDSLVITPMMTYDMKKKMERRFFQDELMRGRDYLDYIKDTLWRGRVAAAQRGCYISQMPPYGYDRVKIGKDWTLEPNENADIVKMIFEWYVKEGLSLGDIVRRLDEQGVPAPRGGTWKSESKGNRIDRRGVIGSMLRNPTYAGKIRFNFRKVTPMIEGGVLTKKAIRQEEKDIVLVEGKHPAIVSEEMFEAAQTRLKTNPHFIEEHGLKNVLAGVLRCKNCGLMMDRVSLRGRNRPARARIDCHCRPRCYKSADYETVVSAVVSTLETVSLPDLQVKLKNGDGDAVTIQKRRIDKLVKQLTEFREQEEYQYELLETRVITPDVFQRRNTALREKMATCEKELHFARQAMPQRIDYAERVVALQDAIDALRDPTMPIEEKNRLLRAVVDHIDYSSVDLGYAKTDVQLDVYLRFN